MSLPSFLAAFIFLPSFLHIPEVKASGGCGDDLGCGGPHTNGHSAGKFSSPVELEEFMDASLIALEQLHKDEGAANA